MPWARPRACETASLESRAPDFPTRRLADCPLRYLLPVLLLLQIAAVVGLARVVRWLFTPLKQPAVIAEMVAGVMLGPSCLGWLQPQWFAALFPQSSLGALNALSQIGLVLFMFLVGRRVSSRGESSKPSRLA